MHAAEQTSPCISLTCSLMLFFLQVEFGFSWLDLACSKTVSLLLCRCFEASESRQTGSDWFAVLFLLMGYSDF